MEHSRMRSMVTPLHPQSMKLASCTRETPPPLPCHDGNIQRFSFSARRIQNLVPKSHCTQRIFFGFSRGNEENAAQSEFAHQSVESHESLDRMVCCWILVRIMEARKLILVICISNSSGYIRHYQLSVNEVQGARCNFQDLLLRHVTHTAAATVSTTLRPLPALSLSLLNRCQLELAPLEAPPPLETDPGGLRISAIPSAPSGNRIDGDFRDAFLRGTNIRVENLALVVLRAGHRSPPTAAKLIGKFSIHTRTLSTSLPLWVSPVVHFSNSVWSLGFISSKSFPFFLFRWPKNNRFFFGNP